MTLAPFRFVLSLVGLMMAFVAVLAKDQRVTWAAIAVLVVAFALRFAPGGKRPPTVGDQ
ncbi:MAG: hypothetical protein ABIR59_11465 [Gemmatimonadales bacterium]